MSNRIRVIEEIITKNEFPHYRLKQVITAIYRSKKLKYSEINTLPINLRDLLIAQLGDNMLSLSVINKSEDSQVQKILFETKDGERIESVRMLYLPNSERDHFYTSLCVSSQSGCALGCKFCATGKMGFKKNLTSDEIIDQVLYFNKTGNPIKNISFMGMGEPFLNPNLWNALDVLTTPKHIGMSQQRINISTVGITEGIEKLGNIYPQMNLAFSLHSPFPEQRRMLMPVSDKYPIERVFSTLNDYILKTNNKVFIAYALIDNVNDSLEHAENLAKLLKSQGKKSYLYHVNLIRYNPWGDIVEFKMPNNNRVNVFFQKLKSLGIQVTLRKTFGDKIDAACGQLAAKS